MSLLMDIGETMHNGFFQVPLYTYRNFPRREGLTVEQSLDGLGKDITAEDGVQIPEAILTDCVRLCCSLCLLENDPSVIEPDVLSKDRDKFEASGDDRYVDKAHRRGKIGWNAGRRIEVAPHYRRPHMALVWTGRGRAVPSRAVVALMAGDAIDPWAGRIHQMQYNAARRGEFRRVLTLRSHQENT